MIIPFTVLLAIFVLLGGCGTSPAKEKAVLQGDNRDAVNFSGSWELDYSRSDSAQEKLDGIVRELNRDAQRRDMHG